MRRSLALSTTILLTSVNACRAADLATRPLFAPAPSATLKIDAGNLAAADVNGDGRDDLLVPSKQSLHVMLADAKGNFTPAAGSPVVLPEAASEIAIGDVDRNGKLDVVTGGHDTYKVTLLLGDGAGGFAVAPGSPVAARQPGKRPHTHGLALADFNRDGNLDVLTANQDDDDLALLLGDGKAGFTPAPRSPFPCGPSPYPFATADFDGDGNLDVLVPQTGAGAISLLLGDGRGALGAPQTIATPPDRPFFVAAGDITGDGKPDAIVTHDDRDVATILLNDGHGRLAPAPNSPMKLGNRAWTIALLDLNADGHTDLLAAAKDEIRAHLGDGTAKFTPAPGSPYPTGKGTWRLAVGDFNGDGKKDVAVTCVEEGKVVIALRH